MGILIKIIIGIAIFLYVIPQILAFTNRKAFFIYCLIALVILVVVWGQHFYMSSLPDYDPGPGGGLGVLLGFYVTIGYAVGVFISYGVAALYKFIKKSI